MRKYVYRYSKVSEVSWIHIRHLNGFLKDSGSERQLNLTVPDIKEKEISKHEKEELFVAVNRFII